jgi:SAM-dependent methyltransferase
MAHNAQKKFCISVKEKFPAFFTDSNVVDIGSMDINGNNRYLFTGGSYIGIDPAPGRNVDVVCKGHEYAPEEQSDVVVSTECFEHDMYYEATLQNAVKILKPGGLLLFTCASTGRPEHGTLRTSPQNSGTTQIGDEEWGNYYKNLTEVDVRAALDVHRIFSSHQFRFYAPSCDLYFWGIKAPHKGTYLELSSTGRSLTSD